MKEHLNTWSKETLLCILEICAQAQEKCRGERNPQRKGLVCVYMDCKAPYKKASTINSKKCVAVWNVELHMQKLHVCSLNFLRKQADRGSGIYFFLLLWDPYIKEEKKNILRFVSYRDTSLHQKNPEICNVRFQQAALLWWEAGTYEPKQIMTIKFQERNWTVFYFIIHVDI